MRLRVVFQGGGARLVHLLAAAAAIEKIRNESQNFVVESVGGVSAGAFAAAALAVPEPVSVIRERLEQKGRPFVDLANKKSILMYHLFGDPVPRPDWASLSAKHKLSVIWYKFFQVLRLSGLQRAKFLNELKNGQTILRHELNKKILNEVFSDSDNNPYLFQDIDGLSVYSSKLHSGRPHEYSRIRSPSDNIGDAVAMSSSLPFVFSSFKFKDGETDGGVCGELPVQQFLKEIEPDVRVLAISFKPERRKINDVVSYVFGLLASSMNSSVREARQQVLDMNGAVFDLDSDLGTYDFPRAFREELPEKAFDLSVSNIQSELEPIIDGLYRNKNFRHIRTTRFGRDDVTPIYETIEREFPVVWKRSAKIYVDRNLRAVRKATQKVEDLRIYWGQIVAKNRKIVAFKIGLPRNFEDTYGVDIVLTRTSDPQPIAMDGFIIDRQEDGDSVVSLVIFLKDPIEVDESDPLEVSLKLEGDVFSPLRTHGLDFFRFKNRTTPSVENHSFICLLEKWNSPLQIGDLVDREVENEARELFSDYDRTIRSWVDGAEELDETDRTFLQKTCGSEMQHEHELLYWTSRSMNVAEYTGCYVREKVE